MGVAPRGDGDIEHDTRGVDDLEHDTHADYVTGPDTIRTGCHTINILESQSASGRTSEDTLENTYLSTSPVLVSPQHLYIFNPF